ncbi:MAG: hemolysin family protein [Mycobacterium sp.]
MTALISIVIGIAVVLFITLFTGYFVAQEFAYMAVDRSRLKARAQQGDAAAARALTVTSRTSFMLSGAQLGITVTGLLVGYVAEPLIGQGIGTLLGEVNVPSGVGIAVGAVIAIVFSTLIQMLFGELFPKNLAIARPEPVARALATSTTWYLRLFGWLIWLFDQSSNLLLRVLRIEPVHDVEHSATARDLEYIVAESRDAGDLPRELSTLLDRTLDFPSRTAEHAMIPRSRVDVIGVAEPVTDVLTRMARGHTRYPVVGDDTDDLRGVLHLHDLLDPEQRTGDAGSRCRPPVVVPTTMHLPAVLRALKAAGEEMALVIDEYGGFAGALTIEDLAEELVGEIDDEHDPGSGGVVFPEADGWLVPGDLPLDEAERLLDRELPEGDYETVAGLLIDAFGGLPPVGQRVVVPLEPEAEDLVADEPEPPDLLNMEVRSIEKHVPASVFVAIRPQQLESVR